MDFYEMFEVIKKTDGIEGFDPVEYKWKIRERAELQARGFVNEGLERYFEDIRRKFEDYDRRFDECAVRMGIDTSVDEYVDEGWDSVEEGMNCGFERSERKAVFA